MTKFDKEVFELEKVAELLSKESSRNEMLITENEKLKYQLMHLENCISKEMTLRPNLFIKHFKFSRMRF